MRVHLSPPSPPPGPPYFSAKKNDGGFCPCIEYRGLNDTMVKNRHPLPLILRLLVCLQEARWFTKLDLRGSYNLLEIQQGDKWKTAFHTRYSHYEYLVMPFGLCNVPTTFQHFINDVLRDLLDNSVVAYLDDILTFSTTREAHVDYMQEVSSDLRQKHLYAKLKKCSFKKLKWAFTTAPFLDYPDGLSL